MGKRDSQIQATSLHELAELVFRPQAALSKERPITEESQMPEEPLKGVMVLGIGEWGEPILAVRPGRPTPSKAKRLRPPENYTHQARWNSRPKPFWIGRRIGWEPTDDRCRLVELVTQAIED